jgi:8-hydroxy-5-deazaflavin:NADPH oxidoreductase
MRSLSQGNQMGPTENPPAVNKMDHATQNTVGIVGGGAMAAAIATRMAAVGIDVLMHDFSVVQRPSDQIAGLPLTVRPCTLAEVIEPEIVVLALPWSDVPDFLGGVRGWEGRILVDATNPPTGNGQGATVQGNAGSSQVVAGLSFGAQVVKCFNTLPPDLLALPPAEGGSRRVLFVSGDHARAKTVICEMVDAMGFAAIDLGGLTEGGRLQGLPGGQLARRNLMLVP